MIRGLALALVALVVLQGSVFLNTSAYNEMKANALADTPNETIGILLGTLHKTGARVEKVVPCENIADTPHIRSMPNPECLAVAIVENPGLQIIGVYHSHTVDLLKLDEQVAANPMPSRMDKAAQINAAFNGMPIAIIMAVQASSEVWTTAWVVAADVVIDMHPLVIVD